MIKSQIRSEYLSKRMALSQQQVHQYLAMMLEHFHKISFSNIRYVLSYIPMVERNEVVPKYFEEILRDNHANYTLCFPKTDFKMHNMIAIIDDDKMQLSTNKYGITEPVNGNDITASFIDIIFVPLIAFDKKGYRVGYGKGLYDRFIPQCRKNVTTIGLSFFEAIDEIADTNQFDVPLKYCITPQRLYEF